MDFARFIHLIETQTLWFARVDQFEDPLEATFTDAELNYFRSQAPPPGSTGRSMLEAFQGATKMMRASIYVNCWRAGAGESLAMWDLYGKGSGIVAVKSSVGLLKAELASFSASIHIAQVNYIDWDTHNWNINSLVMSARKDSSYQHESEVRAMIWEVIPLNSPAFLGIAGTDKPWQERTSLDPPYGLQVPVNVSKMISEIVVGPRESSWVAELVKRVLDKYNLRLSIKVSDRLTPRNLLKKASFSAADAEAHSSNRHAWR
jgi:hypothetical protein